MCQIAVQNTDTSSTANHGTEQITIGGMFFQEYYGAFTNKYSAADSQMQSARLYVGQNALSNMTYVGNQVLPTGTNPFASASDSTSLTWLWILLGCLGGAVLLGVLGYFVYKNKQSSENSKDRNYNYMVNT